MFSRFIDVVHGDETINISAENVLATFLINS